MVGIAAGAAAAGSIGGGLISASGAESGAATQAAAQNRAADLQMQQFQQTQQTLSPFVNVGTSGIAGLNSQIASGRNALNSAFTNAQNAIPQPMTQSQLVNTPGYAFQLAQGLQSTQAAAAARGLGLSGSSLKAASTYATGLANSNYQTQFNNAQTIYGDQSNQFSNQFNAQNALYNQALQPVTLGENAAATTGYIGQNAAGQAGANIAGAGASLGAGTQSAANSLAGGFSSASTTPFTYLALQNALNNSGGNQNFVDSGSWD